jgi:C4-dicarboxylate-specific signal transduction histidine kinase
MRKGGALFPLYLSIAEVTRGERFVGILRDVTENKQAEKERQRLQEQLIHAGRVGAMGEFATNIAHEVNQPLTAIASYAQTCRRMLEARADGDHALVEIVEKISEQALRGGAIIQRLREFLRGRESSWELSDVNDLVTKASELCELRARNEHVALTYVLATDLPPVLVDRVQIQQVIVNLVNNAIDAAADNEADRRFVEIETSLDQNSDVLVFVSDNGAGLSDEAKQKAFEPFFTTKLRGMGMGLPICRTIIEAHGGKLWLEPRERVRTTFCFALPSYRGENGEG